MEKIKKKPSTSGTTNLNEKKRSKFNKLKMTYLSNKFKELIILNNLENYDSKMLPFFNSENYPFLAEIISSIMSGDSPTSVHKDNVFNFGEAGRSTPPPTTSFLATKQENVPAPSIPSNETNLPEPGKDKDVKDEVDMPSPDANPGYKPDENKAEQKKSEEFKDGKDNKDDGDKFTETSKLNGTQLLDGQWVGADVKEENEEDDSCVVTCLYYTIQCCECTIS